jgi:hypothetical protein
MSADKSHFRKVYKSDHLGVPDLEDLIEEGKQLVFTIKEVKQQIEVVAGKRGEFNIAYFIQPIKPWVLNATNAKQVKIFAGGSPFVEDWKNVPVELYIDATVKMKGDVVGGVRIKPTKPQLTAKAKPVFTEVNFEKAKAAGASIEAIEKAYQLTEEVKSKYLEYVGVTENA